VTTGDLSLGVNRPKRESDHSRASGVKIKNASCYTSTPSISPHSVVLN